MKVALVYDRVNKWGGAERDLLTLHELFPDAPLYTSLYSLQGAPWAKVFPKVVPSFLQKIPFLPKRHEYLGTFMPLAFESFDFSEYDLVVSVTSEAAKGIITKPRTRHICFCLTPTRYLWSGYSDYFKGASFKAISYPVVSYLRTWDKIAAQRPDLLVAISSTVQARIKRYYQRDSLLIHPPVDVSFFKKPSLNTTILYSNVVNANSPFFLLVSRLVPYKRADLAVEVFNKLGLPLIIVGKGSEESRLKKMAKGNIKFLGKLTDSKLSNYYSKARALIFPQEEDFGKVVVEAHAAGTPTVAYKAGGALDTVIEGANGVFFEKQTVAGLTKAVKDFEKMSFDRGKIVESAERFSKDVFKNKFLEVVNNFNG